MATTDDTLPPLAHTPGVVCPQCRTVFPHASAPEVCPIDGGALVDTRVFADSGEDSMLGRTIGGRFSVVARIGGGSMGTVYRARQEGMARDVALKILRQDRVYDAQAKARFEREARASSVLVSPSTVRVYDFGQEADGSLFLAMELLDGESLGQRLRRVGKLPVLDAVRLARDVLASLSEAHEKGIIHRDVKPDNIFLTRTKGANGAPVEAAKVLDFGIAKVLRGEAGVDALETQAGTVFGTPRYMSPEQAQGKALDARSDLYALAIILFQMISGRPPFEDEDAVVVMARHIKAAPPKLSECATDAAVPRELDAVLDATLAKDPQRRPATAAALSELLEEAVASWSPDVTARPQALPARRPARSLPRWVIVAAAAALGLAAFAGAFSLLRRPAPSTPAASPTPSATASASASASATAAPSGHADAVPLEALPVVDERHKPKPRDKGRPSAPPVKVEPPKPEPPKVEPPPPPKPKYDRFD